ncbi:MAG: hypothetical protein ABSC15_03025 [Terriglobales bacterium]|jgi:hypothetical protein
MSGITDPFSTSFLQVRSVKPVITVNSQDVTSVVYPSLKTLTYKEGIGSQGGEKSAVGDTVEMELADPEGLFRKTWTIAARQPLELSMVTNNWNSPFEGQVTRQMGQMEIKKISISQSKGSGTNVKISATSIPVTSDFRLTKKSRAWTATSLQGLAQKVATDNGLQLKYLPSTNPPIGRADQHDHSDAYMLAKLCSENDMVMKIKDGTLWIRSYADIENSSPVGTFICPTAENVGGLNGRGLLDWDFSEQTEDVYSQCTVSYKDPSKGTVTSATTSDPNVPAGPHLNYHYDHHDGVPQGPGQEITLD